MDWTGLVAGIGIGSIISTLLQYKFNKDARQKDLHFQEKKEAFIGLLQSYHNAAVKHSVENSKTFAYWQMRCELVANQDTIKAIEDIVATNDNREARYTAHESLKEKLRKDLWS